MADATDNVPLDTRLLSDAIIELSISRRNVSIYPRNHPIVRDSLNRAFNLINKIFELRPEITLAIAKDTLIIDSFYLDKKNPVYREFSLCLSRLNIAYVTFSSGLSIEELYSFQHFIMESINDPSKDVQEIFEEYNISCVEIGQINFSAFNLIKGKKDSGNKGISLWEQYVFGLFEGKLNTEEASDVIYDIPPDQLAGLINNSGIDTLQNESYDRVITSYIRRSSERSFSGKEIKKLMDFINELRPELKQQFLSSAIHNVAADLDSVEKSLREMSVDDVIDLLGVINEQMAAIPTDLKNLLDEFSGCRNNNAASGSNEGAFVEDNLLLSPEVTSLLCTGNSRTFVPNEYQEDIQCLLQSGTNTINIQLTQEIDYEFSDEHIEEAFNRIVQELILSDIPDYMTQKDYKLFLDILKEQVEEFVGTGKYNIILDIFNTLNSNIKRNRFPELTAETLSFCSSPRFINFLVESFRIMGRQMRHNVLLLCDYYGQTILPYLVNALIDEEAQSNRKYIIGLISHLGKAAVPEVIKHLDDERWFVKRNILYILYECGCDDVIHIIRPYCQDENHKVSLEALKCLLKAKDGHGIKYLRDCLRSGSSDLVTKAVALSGAFRVTEVVPDLIQMLDKKTITGSDFEEKIPVVKALGQIGDPQALNPLKKILAARTLVFKNSLEKLKETVNSTLKYYYTDTSGPEQEKSSTDEQDMDT